MGLKLHPTSYDGFGTPRDNWIKKFLFPQIPQVIGDCVIGSEYPDFYAPASLHVSYILTSAVLEFKKYLNVMPT